MIILKYWNPQYQIALADPIAIGCQNVYQFPLQEKMLNEVYRGALYYRLRGSSHRISYQQLKKGLLKKHILIEEELLPF